MATATERSESVREPDQETQIGLDENVAAALAYVLGFLTGIAMLLLESDNDHVRFHAAQSIVVFGGLFVVSVALNFVQIAVGSGNVVSALLGGILSLVGLVVWLGGLVIWVYLLVRTYQGENPRIPGAAGIAADLV